MSRSLQAARTPVRPPLPSTFANACRAYQPAPSRISLMAQSYVLRLRRASGSARCRCTREASVSCGWHIDPRHFCESPWRCLAAVPHRHARQHQHPGNRLSPHVLLPLPRYPRLSRALVRPLRAAEPGCRPMAFCTYAGMNPGSSHWTTFSAGCSPSPGHMSNRAATRAHAAAWAL